ncbi:MAG: hypothetical protein AAF191_03935 [Verrucomicrobiota bacterium]
MVQGLDSTKILKTARRLHQRMQERFPERGLTDLGDRVNQVAVETAAVSLWLRRPIWWHRVLATSVILLIAGLLVGVFTYVRTSFGEMDLQELLQTVEAGVNDLIFLAIAIYFFVNLERRYKRRRALKMLHELRSLAHIVDMHQLTKDPDSLAQQAHRTESSPERDLTSYELKRYFDYCSEMLSIISKLAALLVQHFDDPVTLQAVNEVETLTSGLSRKIWQKIMIASQQEETGSA